MNKAQMVEVFAGARNDPLWLALQEVLAEFREELVAAAVDALNSPQPAAERWEHVALGGVNAIDDLKKELETQIEKAEAAVGKGG